MMLAGTIACFATIAVHWHVCYTSLEHLLPADSGLATLWIDGWLCFSYLC